MDSSFHDALLLLVESGIISYINQEREVAHMEMVGVTFFDTDIEMDTMDFSSEHLGCDFIGRPIDNFKAEVAAYADDPDFNIRLRGLFNKEYKDRGYVYYQGISEMEALSIG